MQSKLICRKEFDKGKHCITVSLSNTEKGIVATVSVAEREGNFLTHKLYEDYCVREVIAPRAGRVTEKLKVSMYSQLPEILERHLTAIKHQYPNLGAHHGT